MDYSYLLSTHTADKWQRIGINRRAGVCAPLFHIYSKHSIGIGDFTDLKRLVDWCSKTGQTIIQLLPLNELSHDFSPYNSISTFALEPCYVSFRYLRKVDIKTYADDISKLKEKFPAGQERVNYEIKDAKLKLLRKIFSELENFNSRSYNRFIRTNTHWLKSYAAFKILKPKSGNKEWSNWDETNKNFSEKHISQLEDKNKTEFDFYYWLQWQLYEQLKSARRYANKNNILLLGDLPFLVARDSADVWSHQNYFNLDKQAGAPPDMYFAEGQKWGMPPYNWHNISNDNWTYIKNRLGFAQNFYDMFRIDHFVGLFRLWTLTYDKSEIKKTGGSFEPEQENIWETHGRKIISEMILATDMLPCAEDLGTVPECSYTVLNEFGIPGIDVQRWNKIYHGGFNFKNPLEYRKNSISTVSTHDSSFLPVWWKYEAGSIDEFVVRNIFERLEITKAETENLINQLFDVKKNVNGRLFWNPAITDAYQIFHLFNRTSQPVNELAGLFTATSNERKNFLNFLDLNEDKFNKEFIYHALLRAMEASSIFSIQLLPEYLYLDENILENYSDWSYRINFPGFVSPDNWSITSPFSLEALKKLEINETILKITKDNNRHAVKDGH
jgi:4-alpha-glucanotransferase